MPYATYSDFSARYVTKLTEAEVSSHLLPFAAARLDGALGPYFAAPFAENNLTAADLTIDLAFLIATQRKQEPGDAAALSQVLASRLNALATGKAAMITTSGDLLNAQGPAANVAASVWAGGAHRPVFRRHPWLTAHNEEE